MREAWFAIAFLTVALFAAGCGDDLDGFSPELDEAADSLMARCETGVTPVDVEFDSTVAGPARTSIRQDLKVLSCLNLSAKSNNQLQLMGVSDFTAASMTAWLSARMNYVVGEDYDSTQETKFIAWNYNPSSYYYADLDPLADATTVMSNLGMAVFKQAKQDGAYYALNINGDPKEVKTGRIGVFRIGPALLALSNQVSGLPMDALAHSLIRLGTLLHEGRHDDSNSGSLGYLHAVCPAGFKSLTGQSACEKYSNGPYSLQAMVLANFYEQACVGCSAAAREKIRVLQADRASRVLGNAQWADPRPEAWN